MPHPERNFRGTCFHGNLRVGMVLVTLPPALILKMLTNGLRTNDFNSKFVSSVREKPLFENVSIKFSGGNRYGLIGANGCEINLYENFERRTGSIFR